MSMRFPSLSKMVNVAPESSTPVVRSVFLMETVVGSFLNSEVYAAIFISCPWYVVDISMVSLEDTYPAGAFCSLM